MDRRRHRRRSRVGSRCSRWRATASLGRAGAQGIRRLLLLSLPSRPRVSLPKARLEALLEASRPLCVALCRADGGWLREVLAWLLPAPAAAGEPQDGAARALLAPLLELALAHTHARTPLPEGTVGLLFAACDGDGAAGVPAPLLPALCVASNKWAKDEELAALIDRDHAILDAALDGGGGAAEALSKLHRWVWLSKVRAWRASAV